MSRRTPKDDGPHEDILDRSPAPPPAAGLTDGEATRLARRRLLKVVAYSAPLVIGTFLSRDAEASSCGPPHGCNPLTCGPKGCAPMQ